MDAAEDPPDPDGWPIHPASAFYGLWPRFAARAEADERAAAVGDAGAESVARA